MLNCEPHTIEQLPVIKFTGQAIIEDLLINWYLIIIFVFYYLRREQLKCSIEKSYIDKNISEIVNDIVDNVRTPTPPLPDLENKAVCEFEFETKNYVPRLWYTDLTMALLRRFEKMLLNELNMTEEDRYWDLNIDYITNLIKEIKEEDIRADYERKYIDLLQLLRFRPYQKFFFLLFLI